MACRREDDFGGPLCLEGLQTTSTGLFSLVLGHPFSVVDPEDFDKAKWKYIFILRGGTGTVCLSQFPILLEYRKFWVRLAKLECWSDFQVADAFPSRSWNTKTLTMWVRRGSTAATQGALHLRNHDCKGLVVAFGYGRYQAQSPVPFKWVSLDRVQEGKSLETCYTRLHRRHQEITWWRRKNYFTRDLPPQ